MYVPALIDDHADRLTGKRSLAYCTVYNSVAARIPDGPGSPHRPLPDGFVPDNSSQAKIRLEAVLQGRLDQVSLRADWSDRHVFSIPDKVLH